MDKIWLKYYQEGVPAEINVDAYSSLVELFEQCCHKFKDLPAFRNFGSEINYQELDTLSGAFAAYLQQKLGCQKGERVAIMMPNIMQYPVAFFGILRAGLIVVNVNPLYTVRELVHQINNAGAESIVVLANFAHIVQAALPQTSLKRVIITELGDLLAWPKSLMINFAVKYIKNKVPEWSMPQATLFKKAIAVGRTLKLNPITLQGTDIALLQYTGGTTGVAKGAMLTHRNIIANIEQMYAWSKPTLIEGKEVVITALPLYHIFSLTVSCLTFLKYGAINLLITDPRDIPHFVSELAKTPFTVILGVNTLFNALLNNTNFVRLNFHSLKIALGGGTAVQQATAEHWQKITGMPLLEGYGLTETSPVVCAVPLNITARKGGIGLPMPSTAIQICDENDREVAIGTAGELYVKGPQVMAAYWRQPEETRKVFTADGWLRTGDVARIDEEGFVYLLERKKDMILVSGFNVYPNEVEDVIASHPGVQEVAVIGVPDANSGEAVKAFIVKKDPALTAEMLATFCRQYLTGYKRPHYFEFCAALPKTSVGKILRRELRSVASVTMAKSA